jgi:gliding motility-associated-like protein
MSIIKSATIPEIVKEGAIIEYSIEVTNTGNVTIRNIEITDANAVITNGNPIAILAPGESEIVTAEHIITYSDIVAGRVVNTAYGVGDSPSGIDDVTDTSDAGTEMNGDEIVNPEEVETPDSDGTTNNNSTDDPTITEVIFTEITIPEGFSPNGDGINDNFVIRGLEKYPDNILVIFNRWGNKVYEVDGYLNDWDGKNMFGVTVGGNDLPEGTYFYILKYGKDQTPIKGYVYLKR